MARIKFLIILSLLFCLLISNGYAADVTCSTMVANDSTDNTAALNTCITTAQGQAEKTVIIPAAANYYYLNGAFLIPDGITIEGEETAKVNAVFRMDDNSRLINIEFKSSSSRQVIIGESGETPDEYIDNIWIKDCTFSGNTTWPLLWCARVNNSIFDGNSFSNANSKGSNFQILGGSGNIVTNNITTGGKTGIIFKYTQAANGGGPESKIWNNIITGNTLTGFNEEGLSHDVEGSSAGSWSFLELDTIASTPSSTQVTLSHAGWDSGYQPDYVGMDMVFVDGALAGHSRVITVQSGDTFTLSESITGASASDTIVIAATFQNNFVGFNQINSAANGSILFFGLSFYNRIYGNTVTQGNIELRSLNQTEMPDTLGSGLGNVTQTHGMGPTGFNLVSNNIIGTDSVYCAAMEDDRKCQNQFEYREIPDQGGSNPDYKSYGNSSINNTIYNTNGLFVWSQDYYTTGNVSSGVDDYIGEEFESTLLDYGDVSPYIDFSTPTCENIGLKCVTSYTIAHVSQLDATCPSGFYCAAEGEQWYITNPSPSAGATGQSTTTSLSWTNPTGYSGVDVYIKAGTGCSFTADNRFITDGNVSSASNALLLTELGLTGALDDSTTYCWRVDVNYNADADTQTGTVYEFTTTDGPPIPEGRKPTLKYSPYGMVFKPGS